MLQACATPQACALPTPTVATDACVAFKRLTFDRLNDTLPTIAGIKSYDDARDAVCGVGR